MKYQIFRPMSESEYKELKDDIADRGVMVPVEYDDEGNILDGHHRIKACHELGVTTWPRLIRSGLSEWEKRVHIRKLNQARRHMTPEERTESWKEMRQEGMTYQAIAETDGTVSHETIRKALDDSTFKNLKVTGKDGKARPTKYKPRTTYISQEVAKKAESLPEQYRDAVLLGEKKPMEAAREAKVEEIARTVNLPEAKYRVVYADPPWSYGNTQPDYHTEQRDHYPVMTIAEICEMPINEICETDAVLFLWVTSPILEESFQVIRSWKFTYKASFVWDKIKHNMGHYNSVRHEFLLVCTKGSCQPDVRTLFDSVVTIERTEHSKKPDQFYQIIETLYPYGKRIELFARAKRENWDVYGNEA